MIEPSKSSSDGFQFFKDGAVCLKISKELRIVANDAIAQMEYKFSEFNIRYDIPNVNCDRLASGGQACMYNQEGIYVSSDDPDCHPAGCAGGV